MKKVVVIEMGVRVSMLLKDAAPLTTSLKIQNIQSGLALRPSMVNR